MAEDTSVPCMLACVLVPYCTMYRVLKILPAACTRQVLRPSEKFKFNFDWDSKDDTSRDLNPLYNNLHGAGWRGCGVSSHVMSCPSKTRPKGPMPGSRFCRLPA